MEFGDTRSGEEQAIAKLGRFLGTAGSGESWIGDDAAVLEVATSTILLATDVLVEGIHFRRDLSSLYDIGWKALSVNVSDIAAMAGEPLRCVVGLIGVELDELDELYGGLVAASDTYACPIVGGDLSDGTELVLAVSIVGSCTERTPVLRRGALPGDRIFVTGPLGGSAAGLRALLGDADSHGPHIDTHRRPTARVGEGVAAGDSGARAMLDLSDGLSLDLARLATASGVGYKVEEVPVHEGATEDEAVFGGEDYELLFTAPDEERVREVFEAFGLEPPYLIGTVLEDPLDRTILGAKAEARGFEHHL